MKGLDSIAKHDVWFRWTLATLVAAATVPATAFAADRVVLGEEFSNTG
jgi:hypothetical protein